MSNMEYISDKQYFLYMVNSFFAREQAEGASGSIYSGISAAGCR